MSTIGRTSASSTTAWPFSSRLLLLMRSRIGIAGESPKWSKRLPAGPSRAEEVGSVVVDQASPRGGEVERDLLKDLCQVAGGRLEVEVRLHRPCAVGIRRHRPD